MALQRFNAREGGAALVAAGEIPFAFFAVFLGVVAHWIWETIIAGLPTGKIDFGNLGIILGRLVLSLIVAGFSFAGIYNVIKEATPGLRFFVAFTQGFAIDAFTAPVANALEPV